MYIDNYRQINENEDFHVNCTTKTQKNAKNKAQIKRHYKRKQR